MSKVVDAHIEPLGKQNLAVFNVQDAASRFASEYPSPEWSAFYGAGHNFDAALENALDGINSNEYQKIQLTRPDIYDDLAKLIPNEGIKQKFEVPVEVINSIDQQADAIKASNNQEALSDVRHAESHPEAKGMSIVNYITNLGIIPKEQGNLEDPEVERSMRVTLRNWFRNPRNSAETSKVRAGLVDIDVVPETESSVEALADGVVKLIYKYKDSLVAGKQAIEPSLKDVGSKHTPNVAKIQGRYAKSLDTKPLSHQPLDVQNVVLIFVKLQNISAGDTPETSRFGTGARMDSVYRMVRSLERQMLS